VFGRLRYDVTAATLLDNSYSCRRDKFTVDFSIMSLAAFGGSTLQCGAGEIRCTWFHLFCFAAKHSIDMKFEQRLQTTQTTLYP